MEHRGSRRRRHRGLGLAPESIGQREDALGARPRDRRQALSLLANRVGDAPDRDGDAGARRLRRHAPQHAFVEDLEPARLKRRIDDALDERLRGPGILEESEPRALGLRQWMEPQGELGEDAERTECPDHQLRHVVPADRLHDFRPTPGHDAIGLDEAHPEQQIARGAVPSAQRSARVGRHDAADGARGHAGRIERQPLSVRGERSGQRAARDPRLHRDSEVVGVVLDHLIQPGEIEHDVDTRGRVAELERARGPDRDDGESGIAGQGQQPAQLLDRGRAHEPARAEPVDGRGRESLEVVTDPVATRDRDEGFADRARRDGHRGPQIQAPSGTWGLAGRNPAPQAGCEGRSLPGFMIESGSNARLKRYMKFRSASAY